MDGNRDPRDLFADPNGKKIDPSATPVKRPRQKGLHFDLANVQPQPHNDYPPDFSMQLHGFYPEVPMTGGDVGRWYPELPHYPRRDTPVPETDIEVKLPAVEEPVTPQPPVPLQQWLRKSAPQRHQRPLQPMEHFAPRKPREEPPVMMGHPPFPVETLEERMVTSPFSAAPSERDRFVEFMSGPPPSPLFDPHLRPGMAVMPPPHARKFPSQAGGLFGEDDGYDSFSPAFAAAKDWGGKEAEAAIAGQRLRQARRPRAPGPNREPDYGAFFARPNSLFDFGYSAEAERNSGRISVMRERLRRLEHRHNPLEDNREQEGRGSMERHRVRQQNRERRASCRGGEFGALMNALGLVPDDDFAGNGRDAGSGLSRMREAVFGIVNSRLPPHLLFSDRDFDGDDYEFLSRLDDSVESKKGADDQIINKINLCAFGSGGLSCSAGAIEADSRCPICLENFAPGVEIRVMPCQHQYHRCCLDKWLKIKAVCPICNMNIKDKFLEGATSNCI